MRIPKCYYMSLKKLHNNQGSTKGVCMEDIDWLYKNELIQDVSTISQGYKLRPTLRGLAAIEDTPIEFNISYGQS